MGEILTVTVAKWVLDGMGLVLDYMGLRAEFEQYRRKRRKRRG
ncbi:hypothetical protein [Streptomyces sp. NPDC058872]